MKPVCAVTGANGYVGCSIAAGLAAEFEIVPMGRSVGAEGIRWQMDHRDDLAEALQQRGVKVLVHSAWDFRHPKAAENWRVNVEGSIWLIESALAAGVECIVFISTISAFDGTRSEYGCSKLAVETFVLKAGGMVIRPGLVWGDRPGGMFATLRQQVSKGGIVPVIGDGRYPQYLVHEDDLVEAVRLTVHGSAERLLTVANPSPWLLRDLILRIAANEGKNVKLVGVPWWLIYIVLRTAEMLGFKLSFRSDSVISLVRQNPAPQFSVGLALRRFS